jgi:NAD(P)-dependent dehydrogenase (short-subunit alcohol dehydrogenase family)
VSFELKDQQMKFAGKHVAITGGAGEIGLVMAREFAEQGAQVTVLDKVIHATAERAVEAMGARFLAVDVTAPEDVHSVVQSMPEIDVAIANAGVHRGARLLDVSFENWQLQMSVNLTGVFLFVQAAARKMVARRCGGAILVTGSWVQDVPSVDNTAYCVSKSGAAMLARCAALELGEHQIRVNVVAPGIVNAGMARRQIEVDPAFARKATMGLPLGRLQTAEQIAKAAAYLCSDDAESTTGTTLLVDGGASLFKYE